MPFFYKYRGNGYGPFRSAEDAKDAARARRAKDTGPSTGGRWPLGYLWLGELHDMVCLGRIE